MRRIRRGFSLLEALIGSSVFLAGVLGTIVFAANSTRLMRKGAVTTQMVQAARLEVQARTVAGITSMGAPGTGDVLDAGVTVFGATIAKETRVFDTSSSPGSEVTFQMPGCRNLGVPSRCVKVVVTDTATNVSYISTAYVML
jgi:hypothetical protein